jgi:hypothetical protein
LRFQPVGVLSLSQILQTILSKCNISRQCTNLDFWQGDSLAGVLDQHEGHEVF